MNFLKYCSHNNLKTRLKIVRIMKLTVLFLMVSMMQVNAYIYAQDVTLTARNASLKDVITELRKQTGYGFLYTDVLLETAKPVNLSVRNAPLPNVLSDMLVGQPIAFTIENETVVFKSAPIQVDNGMQQNIEVSGEVRDEEGVPLPAVTVKVKNTSLATSTDALGHFRMTVSGDAILVISSLGFLSQEIPVNNRRALQIRMIRSTETIDDVMVVAYGTITRGESTASVTQINYDDLKNRSLTNIASALEGAGPGIQSLSASGQPGEAPAIRIRGFGSINADQNPIYVVDGAIYDGGLSNFNMEDVQSLSVLKDAASTALYGARGANGVIIITTKSGQGKRPGLNVKVNQGLITRALPEYDRLDAYQYYPKMWEAYRNLLISAGQSESEANETASRNLITELGYNPFNVPDDQIVGTNGMLNPQAQLLWADDLDWAKAVERMGHRQEYSLGFNGSGESSNYYGSLSYVDETGFVKNSDQDRFMGRLNANVNPLTWLKAGLNLSGTLTNSNRAGLASSLRLENPFYFARNIGPIYPVHLHDPSTGAYLLDNNGDKIYDLGAAMPPGTLRRPGGAFNARHMVMENELDKEWYVRNYTGARSHVEISLLEGLKATANISLDLSNTDNNSYGNNIIGASAPAGTATKSNTRTTSYTFNQLLEYDKTIGSHKLSVMAGHENYSRNIQYKFSSRTNQIMENNYELTNFAVVGDVNSQVDNYRIESYLSRVNYTFDDKYILSGSLRRDGNSRFRSDLRWETFYSVGAAWRLDQESFLINHPSIDMLKVRGSFGRVGNDAGIGYYPYQALYALGFNNGPDAGIRQSNIGSSDLTWEGQKSLDAAVEFSLWNSRLNGTIEYYDRVSDDLIFDVVLPLSLGGYTVSKNIGALSNSGWEVQLNGDLIRKENWRWNLGLSLSTLKNKVTRMPDDRPEIIQSGNYRKLSVGHSIYDFWLVESMGVDAETGVPLYRALNTSPDLADNIIRGADTLTTNYANGAFHYAGTAVPDVFGSIQSNLRFKSFTVSLLLSYQIGGQILDQPYASLMHNGSYGVAWHSDILNSWTQPGDVTDIPKVQNSAVNYYTSRYLEDASYLNVRNVGLSYTLPQGWLSRLEVRNARVYVNGENLHWFSARKGMNVQQTYTGITSNVYVPARTVTFGVNFDF